MASDLPKHHVGASANIRAQLGRIDQQSWGSPFLINAPNSKRADRTGLQTGALISDKSPLAETLKPLQSSLQDKSGVDIGMTYFQNWGDTQESLLLYAKPQTVSEVQQLVKGAADPDINIKVGMGGAYHSWSPMFPDEGGLLINVCDLKLNTVPTGDNITTDGNHRIYYDKTGDPMTVTISPGVTTGELMEFFLNNEICFESDTIISTVTYGGVLSGGCHGTGKDQTSMCDWITTMKVVDGNGTLRTLPGTASDLPGGTTVTIDEIRKAAQVSLGVFGVVVEFTLKVQPMSNRRVQNTFDYTLGDIFPRNGSTAELSRLIKKNWSVELFWFPFNSLLTWVQDILPTASALQINTPRYPVPAEGDGTPGLENILVDLWNPRRDELWIREITKTRKEVTQEPGVPLWSKVLDVAGGVLGNQLLAPLYAAFPGMVPLGTTTGFNVVKKQYGEWQKDEVVRIPWAVHFRDAIDLISVYDLEFCFPIDIDDPTKAVQAVQAVIEITRRYAKRGEYPSEKGDGEKIHFPLTMCMEMRILKKGNALLCPSSIGDHTHIAYVEVLSTSGTQGYEQYFTEVATAWIELGGIPHWHKQWTFLMGSEFGAGRQSIFEYIRSKYGTNLTTFNTVRSQLNLDPDDRFLNATMQDVLYGPGASK